MGTFRFLAALGAASLAAAGACYEDATIGPPSGKPLARVLLTDAPIPYDSLQSINVYVARIEASATADTSGGGGDWTLITEPRRRFDLLTLQQGATAFLGEGPLDPGQYSAIRMTINTDSSSIRWLNGSDAQVNWQNHTGTPEMPLYALVEARLAVEATGAEIVIDFDVGRSFLYDFFGTGEFTFIPWIRAVNSAATGAIEGYVTTADSSGTRPVANANVTIFRGEPTQPEGTWYVAATGRTGATGYYKVAFLRPDTYIVRVEQPRAPSLAALTTSGVEVRQGATTTHSVSLTGVGAGGAYIRILGPDSVGVGGRIFLYVVVGDENGDSVPNPIVSWRVSDSSIAALQDSAGQALVTGLRAGVVSIFATSNGLSDSAVVEVIGESSTAPVATVTISPDTRTLVLGDSLQQYGRFDAVLGDSIGNLLTNRPVAWSLSDTTVADLSSTSGPSVWVFAKRAGSATLRATSEGKIGQATVTVAGPVATVSVSPASKTLILSDSLQNLAQFTALLRDAAGTVVPGRPVFWSLSDTTVASLILGPATDPRVWVYGKKVGSTTLTATSDGKSGPATVTVQP